MFDHIGLSTPDLEVSKAFYEKALAPLGITCLMNISGEGYAYLGFGKDRPQFWIGSGELHRPGLHIAFAAASRDLVDAFYKAAIAAGGTDNGAPGLRPQYHPDYYGAFVLDPDGHNIEAVCHKPQTS